MLTPLTAYAHSKIATEKALEALNRGARMVTSLRFVAKRWYSANERKLNPRSCVNRTGDAFVERLAREIGRRLEYVPRIERLHRKELPNPSCA